MKAYGFLKKSSANTIRIYLLFSCILFSCFQISFAEEPQILAVQSKKLKPFEDALAGFKTVCDIPVQQLILSEQKDGKLLANIKRINPDLILAIGNDALNRVKDIKTIPIIYLLILNPESIIKDNRNITGVSLNIPAQEQLSTFVRTLPEVKRIGIIYDPNKTGSFVSEVQALAKQFQISIVAREVKNPTMVFDALKDIKDDVDALWMLPDLTVVPQMTTPNAFLFCLEHNLPVVSFSEKYISLGAVLSIGIDVFDIGKQAGEMAQSIFSIKSLWIAQQQSPRSTPLSFNPLLARKTSIFINRKIAQKLDLKFNKKVLENARTIN